MNIYPKPLFLLQCCCLIGSGILLAKPIYRWGRREISQQKATALWQHTQASPPVHKGSGAPALWLRIPSCTIDDLVLYEDTRENLDRHPCIAQESPTVILGHRDTHFRKLHQIQLFDTFDVEHPDGSLQMYRVTEIEILPAEDMPTRVAAHRNAESLLLVTCHPFNYFGPAPNRFMVWAQPAKVHLLSDT
jgi:LPXTG-site transpeptidase (sortase) family protein